MTHQPQEQEDTLGTIVRDLTSVYPISKSEARRRISDLVERAKKEGHAEGYALGFFTGIKQGRKERDDRKLIEKIHTHLHNGKTEEAYKIASDYLLDNHPQENEKSNTGKPAR